jgi:hypothetical protein
MANLAANPSGGSGVYGQPGAMTDDNALGIVSQLKDREMKDFKDKANFMSDLSLKQDRMRRIFDTAEPQNPQGPQNTQGMNVVLGKDPNAMTGYEKGELGIRQQQLGQEGQKIAQSGKLGQESMDIRSQQEKLNQQKSDQANTAKMADLQRKVEESTAAMGLSHEKLKANIEDHASHVQFLKDKAAADLAKQALDHAQIDAKAAETKRMDDAKLADIQEKLKQSSKTKTTTELDPSGNKRTVTTEKGSSNTVSVIGKDGKPYTIPKDKLNDMDADGTPHWKQQGEQ